MVKKSYLAAELGGIPESKREEVFRSVDASMSLVGQLLEVILDPDVYQKLYRHYVQLQTLLVLVRDIPSSDEEWEEWSRMRIKKKKEQTEQLLKDVGLNPSLIMGKSE